MPSQPFDGFEKSAPKSLPNTRADAGRGEAARGDAARGEARETEPARRRRVEPEEDDGMIKGNQIMPDVQMAIPMDAPSAHATEIVSADDLGEEEQPRKRKRVDDSPDQRRPRSIREREAREREAREQTRDALVAPSSTDVTASRSHPESAWDSGITPTQEIINAVTASTELMFERLLEKQNELIRAQQKLHDKLTSSEFGKKDAMFVGLILFTIATFVLIYFLKN